MLNPYMRYISEEKCIVGRHLLACRRELAEGKICLALGVAIRLAFSHRVQCETALKVLCLRSSMLVSGRDNLYAT